MALSSYGLNHPLAVKVWSQRLFEESIKDSYVGKFLGTGSNSVFQRKTELSKGAGDRIRVGLRMLLTGDGVQGDSTLEGNEEALTTYSMDIVADQLRHAVRSAGKMSEQRIPFSIREEAMQGLKDWWTERLERSFANHICGNTAQTDVRYTGLNAPTAPDTQHVLYANSETAEASISTSTVHYFTLTMLDKAVVKAKTLSPKIRPVRMNGNDMYVAFLHPNQVYQMRTNTNTAQWADIQKAAMAGMASSESPLFTGALGVYNGVILHEWAYMPAINAGNAGAGANIFRAVLCGAQAAVMASAGSNGASASWNEEMFDYGNQLGVEAGMIFGVKKTVFNSADFATITMSTYSPTPT